MLGYLHNVIAVKKFGFILADNGQEYFFHETSCETSFDELVMEFDRLGRGKVQVTFEPTKSSKGPRAENVELATGQG